MVGKRVRGALYVHREALGELTRGQQQAVADATSIVPDCAWNVVRLEPHTVGLLLYESFDEVAFPALLASTRIDLATRSATSRSFQGAANPLILHRKEQMVVPSDPRVSPWATLTADLEALGLFRDLHLIGRRQAWERRLAEAGVRVEGHALCPI